MKLKIQLLISVFFFVLAASPSLSQPSGMGMRRWRGENPCWRASELNLSHEQRQGLDLIHQTHFRETQLLRLQLFTKRLELRELITNPTAKTESIRGKNSEIIELQLKQEEKFLEYLIKIRNLLSPEQLRDWCPEQEFPASRQMMHRPDLMTPMRPEKDFLTGENQGVILSRQENKARRSFSPIFLGIFSGIILIILIVNGLLEINRTRNGFYLLLEKEGAVLIQHLEKNIQETLTSLQWMESGSGKHSLSPPFSGLFFGLEDTIAEYLLEAIHRVDQLERDRPLNPSDFKSLVDRYRVTSIEIYNSKGNRLKGWPLSFTSTEKGLLVRELVVKKEPVAINLFGKPFSEDQLFSIAIWRGMNREIIAVYLNGEQIKTLLRQFAIQREISDMGLRESILYISVQDASFNTLSHTNPALIGKKEEDPFLRYSLLNHQLSSRHYQSLKGEEIFEVVKSFSLKDKTMG
jgi:Spy/CpxP family protein refolding chaperone